MNLEDLPYIAARINLKTGRVDTINIGEFPGLRINDFLKELRESKAPWFEILSSGPTPKNPNSLPYTKEMLFVEVEDCKYDLQTNCWIPTGRIQKIPWRF